MLYFFIDLLKPDVEIFPRTNHVLSSILFSRPNLGRARCAIWFRFQGVGLHAILALFELILIVRSEGSSILYPHACLTVSIWIVFALYGKSRKVGMFLMIAMCTELGVMAFSAVRLHRSLRFDESCLVLNTPKESFALGYALIVP